MAEFKNPNQPGGTGDNRSLLVMLLVMMLAFAGLRFFQAKHNPQTASPNGVQQTGGQTPVPEPTVNTTVAGQTIQIPVTPAVVAASESTTTVENELYKITFSNRGAVATSWILKKYKDSYGQPLDLVHTQAAQSVGYPLSLYTYDQALTSNLNSALYLPSATGNLTAPTNLSFHYVSGGYEITKTFSFDNSYSLHADTVVLRNGAPVRALLSWPGGFGDQEDVRSYGGSQVDYSQDGKETHLAPNKVSGGNTLNGNFGWAGVSDLYFAAIFLPDHPESASISTTNTPIVVPKANRHNGLGQGQPSRPHSDPAKDEVKVPIVGAALGDLSGHTQTRLFAGPKAVDVLRNVHASDGGTLEPLLDFGFFSIIGKYLFLALLAIHKFVASNWGWAIIVLTVLINLVILPLRVKTMVAGLKMQRLQPEIERIKAKYKNPKMNDPKFNEMNAEVMQYQKDQGVNMFGGCIPTLIQMPLLFAFFGMLPKVVELRQAHWGWIPDLSSADPWHILPALMVVSQFLVQWYTPAPGQDPQQQKMLAITMPIFSGYMTYNYAAGLALYWSVGNLISIATQQIMNRTALGREMRELAAKRARRKAGVGAGQKIIAGKTVRR